MKILLKQFKSNWMAETPKVWKWIRNLAGTVTACLVILSGIAGMFPDFNVPAWFTSYGWYIAGVCAIITGYSGQKK